MIPPWKLLAVVSFSVPGPFITRAPWVTGAAMVVVWPEATEIAMPWSLAIPAPAAPAPMLTLDRLTWSPVAPSTTVSAPVPPAAARVRFCRLTMLSPTWNRL